MLLKRDNVEIETDNVLEIEAKKSQGFKEIAQVDVVDYRPLLDIDSMTVKELHEIAKDFGIHGATSLRKAELIDVLKKVIQ